MNLLIPMLLVANLANTKVASALKGLKQISYYSTENVILNYFV